MWGPDDWDACIVRGPALVAEMPPHERALFHVLEGFRERHSMTVADLGCGVGRLLSPLAALFGRVTAIDYAPATLSLARRACASPNVAFRRRDLRNLVPFRNAFHVGVAVDSILGPRIEDIDRMLEQIHASLAWGGILCATVPAAVTGSRPVPMRLAGGTVEPVPTRLHEVELQYRLTRAGFLGVRLQRFGAVDGTGDRLLVVATKAPRN